MIEAFDPRFWEQAKRCRIETSRLPAASRAADIGVPKRDWEATTQM
jgi:hypothetical protein